MATFYTEQQKQILAKIRDWCDVNLEPVYRDYDKSGEFPLALVKKGMKDLELHKVEVPKEYGGQGLDYKTTAMIFELIATYDPGFSINFVNSFVPFRACLLHGEDVQKKIFADILLKEGGGMAAFTMTEPQAGSDVGAIVGTAIKEGNEYVINKHSRFVTDGQFADVYTVIALTDPSKGQKGLSALIVERDRAGIEIGRIEDKVGLRLANTCDINFTNVRVPADHLIGGVEGKGFMIAMELLNLSRAFVGTLAVGICQRAIDEAVKYAKERHQFGKPIAKQQAVSFMIADMYIQTEAARVLVQNAMDLQDRGEPGMALAGAIVKTFCGDTVVRVTTDAIQVWGGHGLLKDNVVEKLWRDSKVFQIFEGTNQICRLTIGNQLLR